MSGGGEPIGFGRAAGAVSAGLVVAWVLVVVVSVGVLGLHNQPAAIVAFLPGEVVPPVPLWERIRWHPISLVVLLTAGTFLASLAGSAVTCWIARRTGWRLLCGPVLGALISPGMLFRAQFGEVVDVVAMVVAAVLGAVVARAMAGSPYQRSSTH